MKMQPNENIERIARFIGLDPTPELVTQVVEKTSFQAMKTDPTANYKWLEEKLYSCLGPRGHTSGREWSETGRTTSLQSRMSNFNRCTRKKWLDVGWSLNLDSKLSSIVNCLR